MSRDLDPATIATLSEDVVYPFFAVELKFDGDQVLRMWTGQAPLVLPDGTEWVGAGNLLNISSVEETTEMAVKGASVTLSGIPSEVLSLALNQPYQGRVCNIYFGFFAGPGEPTLSLLFDQQVYGYRGEGEILNEIFSGYMDQMNLEDGAETATIEMKVENKLIDLERARVARFTSGYQKSIYPNDLGLDFLEGLQDKKLPWGRASA